MLSIDEIKEYKTRYIDLYSKVREEQKTDQTYIDDSFEVSEVKTPHHIYRSGLGVRIVDAPAEQIITSNPQVFVEVLKGNKESGERIGEVLNQRWMDILRRGNPNIFKESVKNPLGRGETYLKLVHNEAWALGKGIGIGLPVYFIVLDPMVVYASPEEDENGIPERVVVFYGRQAYDVIPRYPNWSNPKQAGIEKQKNQLVEWFEYWDQETRYIEADGEPILKGGRQPNIYGFTPFIRKYSGFGRRSPDGKLSSLIVSDIRRSRDLLLEECATRSNLASIEYLFAHKPKTFIAPGLDVEKLKESIHYGAYDVNYLDADPSQVKIIDTEITPSPDMYKHHADIIAQLNQRHPFIMAGFPFGTSGIQQGRTEGAAMRRYDSVVENTENLFATGFEMALKIIKSIPGLWQETGLRKDDLDTVIKCQVKLKAKDPIDEDRQKTMGNQLWFGGKGSISLKTLHTQYQGMTEDESKREIAQMLADQVTIFNPDIAAVMGMVAAKEGGMESWLQEAQQRRQEIEGAPGLRQEIPPSGQERIAGEVETPLGREQGIATKRGGRRPPVVYTRGR